MELLFALGLVGLALGMALPRIDSVRSAYFSDEAGIELANTVRSASTAAVCGRTTVALMVAPGRSDLLEERRLLGRTWGEEGVVDLTAGDDDWRGIWDAPVVRHHVIKGVVELEAPVDGIVFFANGTSTGGRITVRAEDGDLTHCFLIDPATSGLFAQ